MKFPVLAQSESAGISPARRAELEPLPKVSLPGFAFPYAMSSRVLLAGTEGCTASARVMSPSFPTGSKSANRIVRQLS